MREKWKNPKNGLKEDGVPIRFVRGDMTVLNLTRLLLSVIITMKVAFIGLVKKLAIPVGVLKKHMDVQKSLAVYVVLETGNESSDIAIMLVSFAGKRR